MVSLKKNRAPKRTSAHAVLLLGSLCASISLAAAQQLPGKESSPVGKADESSQPAEPPFDLLELRVLGNTVLDIQTIERVLTPHLGLGRTLSDVEAARGNLESAYHDRGFGTVFVDIPEQTIGPDGVVRLRVTESRIRKTSVTGARYFSNRQIRNSVPEAGPGVVPNLPVLQSQLGAVNAVTVDRNVVPVLKAGPEPGTVDLDIKVKDHLPLHAVAELNDQYTADTTRLRASLAISYDNVFGHFDSASLQYQTSPQNLDEVKVFGASYVARLGSSAGQADRITLTFINSSSQVATVGDINVAGKGRNYSARYSHPVANLFELQSGFTLGADYKDSAQDVRVSSDSSLSTPLSYASLQVAYNLLLRESSRTWTWAGSLALGLSGLGSSRQEFADKCFHCRPNFSVLRMEAGMRQMLWRGLQLGLQASGQYAVDPLISNEQLLLGGARSVRGYLEAEEIGDIGVRGAVEIRATQLFAGSNRWWSLQPFIFADAGMVRFQKALPGQPTSTSLQSAGLGLDFQARDFLSLSLVLAEPLADASRTKSGDERLEFLIRTSW
jgi:hemolysin activation/secretion protein